MIRSYILLAYRSLLKKKAYTAINVFGLAVGITCCLLISLYVHHELSYDTFFTDSDRIYRVALERQYPNNTKLFGSSPVNLASTLKENYDEVEEAGRIHRLFFQNQQSVTIGDRSFVEKKYLFADDNFFKVFSHNFIEGNALDALNGPNKVVLTASIAKKFYGEETALNKTYRIDTTVYVVSGVIEDIPSNSHIHFDILGSIQNLGFLEQAANTNNWISPWLYTYIKLKEGIDPNAFQSKFGDMVTTYGLPSILTGLGISEADYPQSGNAYNYFLQPLKKIHLYSNLDIELEPNSNIQYIYLLLAIVAFILIISCINFINLSTARSTERAKEVGVRKVLGSNRVALIKQFLVESNLVSVGALIIAILLLGLSLPAFNNLIEKNLSLDTLASPLMVVALIAFAILVGSLAGLYPAFVLSSFDSATVLKGNYKRGSKGINLRNSLIVFQFFISITMISCTLFLHKQMNYMRNKNLGFNKENTLVIEQAQALGQQSEVFKNSVQNINGVISAGGGFAMPGDFIGNFIANSDIPDVPQVRTFTITVDDDYVPTLGFSLVAGRNFGREFNDSLNVLINETAMQLLGYENPIGRKIINPSPNPGAPSSFNVIGVLKDYHHHSLHTEIPPMILFNSPSNNNPTANIAIKVNSDNVQNVISQLETQWNQLVPNQPVALRFLDEKLENLYHADGRTAIIFRLFTFLAIVLACVGLFGLSAFVTQQRTKEIGVRKVLGASISNIILMLSKDLTKLIFISYLISIPLVFIGMNKWLGNFAYRTDIDVITLFSSGLLTLILAWTTISYYAIKVALSDAVTSLRNE